MDLRDINNKVMLVGDVVSNYEYNHDNHGESFYTFKVRIERTSGHSDIIPVLLSDRLVDVNENIVGRNVSITGQYRSYNQTDSNGKKRLVLLVFAKDVEIDSILPCVNEIDMIGYVCKEPVYRETPLGREISDLLVAVNRAYGKSDYIPCIAWGRNARFASKLDIGTKIHIKGRIQSREYSKNISNEEVEIRTAYEVSVIEIEPEVLEEKQND